MSDITSTAATTLPVTLAEIRRHVNASSTVDDKFLEELIEAATLHLEKRCGRCFMTQTRTLKLDSFDDRRYVRGRRIYPPRSPIANTSGVVVTYVDTAGTTTTMPTSDYVVSTGDRPGFIAEAYNATWPSVYAQPNSVTVSYETGDGATVASVPRNVKLAIQMLTAHWYSNREAVLTGTISKEVDFGVTALLEGEAIEHYA